MLYSDLGDNARAIEKLKAGRREAPDEHTLAALASVYEQSLIGGDRNAAETLERAVELEPDNPRVVQALAEDRPGTPISSTRRWRSIRRSPPRIPVRPARRCASQPSTGRA